MLELFSREEKVRNNNFPSKGFVKFVDFEHILMYIKNRKRDNVKEGVPLPIKRWNIKEGVPLPISQRWNIKA